jgi:hypothetical protein
MSMAASPLVITYIPTQAAIVGNIYVPNIKVMSLHTSDPGTTGTGELTRLVGGYQRLNISWGWQYDTVARYCYMYNTSLFRFFVPIGNSIARLGFWDSAGTTFLACITLPDVYEYTVDGYFIFSNFRVNFQ